MKIGIDTDSRALRGLSMSSAAGHNLSQGDLESEGESEKNPANTGTGCYKNYDHHQLHHRRSNQQHSHPEPDAQQPSYSPVPQRREWSADTNNDQDDVDNDNEQLIESEEQQKMQPYMRASKVEVEELRRQIAMENQLKDPKVSRRVKTDIEIPSEFECCFCSSDAAIAVSAEHQRSHSV
ncbi:hypothetical protein PVAND_007729 [Polypedilum vanderplanki]|uniref:Uncharacterized protein n=1 Tax=Polypedilum vanderplanki TaxID=319348 RepID=A0A9J6C7V3_POLVA|nr:hypothetical protein PVAND_007729 [Polypedilum vanderplanki]